MILELLDILTLNRSADYNEKYSNYIEQGDSPELAKKKARWHMQ